MSREQLEADLEALHGAVESQLGQPHPPQTTLEILDERNTEEFWERYLAYFLDPGAPHGFETDVLQAFLCGLAEAPHSTLRRPRTDLSHTQVETQVSAKGGTPDILLWHEDEWFLLIELKVRSGESTDQTTRYGRSSWLGPLSVEDFPPEDRFYVYLTNSGSHPPADAETFDTVRWGDVIEHLESVIRDDRGKYPAKSRAQYRDYLDTIKNELSLVMTDYSADLRDRAILEQEYKDTINAVHGSMSDFIDQQVSEWETELHRTLDDSGVAGDWQTSSHGTHYLHVYRPEWTLDDETLTVGPEDGAVTALYMIPLSTDTLHERELKMNFKISRKWIGGSVGDSLRSYVDNQADRLQQFIEEDARIRQESGSAVYTVHVPYDIQDGHSVGEQVAQAVMETDPELHDEVSALFGDAVGSISQ